MTTPAGGASFSATDYVELAALIVPEQKSALKQRLRGGCSLLPMPLIMGWEKDPLADSTQTDPSVVPGLLLSNIKSGATRHVQALWMHVLYEEIRNKYPKLSAVQMELEDVGFNSRFSWPQVVIICTCFTQFLLGVYALNIGQLREGLLIITGLLVRMLEALLIFSFPANDFPRPLDKVKRLEDRPYYVLHTGMTTTHLILLAHKPSKDAKSVYINLEDAAVPLKMRRTGGLRFSEMAARTVLVACRWIWKAACILIPSNSYMIAVVLALGGAVVELLDAVVKGVPRHAGVLKLDHGVDVLDMISTISQKTGQVSPGFVESILPDPNGSHGDYQWIKDEAISKGVNATAHPTHPNGETILSNAKKRVRVRRPTELNIVSPTESNITFETLSLIRIWLLASRMET